MTYLDIYEDCAGCPVSKYCGTIVSSIKLCKSYENNTYFSPNNNSHISYRSTTR